MWRSDRCGALTGVEFRSAWFSGGRGAPTARHRSAAVVTQHLSSRLPQLPCRQALTDDCPVDGVDGVDSLAGVAAGVASHQPAGTAAVGTCIALGMAGIAASMAGIAEDMAGIAAGVALRPLVI